MLEKRKTKTRCSDLDYNVWHWCSSTSWPRNTDALPGCIILRFKCMMYNLKISVRLAVSGCKKFNPCAYNYTINYEQYIKSRSKATFLLTVAKHRFISKEFLETVTINSIFHLMNEIFMRATQWIRKQLPNVTTSQSSHWSLTFSNVFSNTLM